MQERQSLLNTLSSMNRKVVKLQAEKETLSTRISKAQGDHAKEIVVYVRGGPMTGEGKGTDGAGCCVGLSSLLRTVARTVVHWGSE